MFASIYKKENKCKVKRLLLPFLVICTLLLSVWFTNFTISAEAVKPKGSDMVVVNETETISGDYTLDGSIVVRDNGTLIVEGKLQILQDYDYQHSIEIRNNGSLFLENGSITSNHAVSMIIKNNAYLEMTDSVMDFDGMLNATSAQVNVSKSTLTISSTHFDICFFSVSDTTIDTNALFLENTEFELIDSYITCGINATKDSVGVLTNVSLPSVTANNNAEVEIYRWLTVNVNDNIGVPVGNAYVRVEDYDGNEVLHNWTNDNGQLTCAVLSDIITHDSYPGSDFVGNYLIQASYKGFTATNTVALPHYKTYTNPEHTDNTKSVEIKFSEVFLSSYYAVGSDIIIAESTTRTIEDSYAASDGVTYTFIQDGNIRIKNNATLIIKNNTMLNILQRETKRYFISIEDNGKLIVENSEINSDYQLNLYLFGNASFDVKNSNLRVNIVANDFSKILLENTNINGDVYAKCELVSMDSVMTASSSLMINVANLSISDSVINTTYLHLDCPCFSIINTVFNQSLELKDSEVYLINVSAPSVVALENITVYRSWWLRINVINGHDRNVPDAEVKVFYLKNMTEQFYSSGITDTGGVAVFQVIGSMTTSEDECFIGNYKIVAYYNNHTSSEVRLAMNSNKQATLKFSEPLVPPYIITVDADFPSSCSPDDTVTVSGRVYYNHDLTHVVPNANVMIKVNDNTWNTVTDENGRYTQNIIISKVGVYNVTVTVSDPLGVLPPGETSKTLTVKVKKAELNILVIVGGIVAVILCLLGIKFVFRKPRVETEGSKMPEITPTERKKEITRFIVERMMGGSHE